ncbi:class Ib ribonucleoside-diphosphate reductase assembly flavoprotein NrdI, partial [Klebsiella pneumoniae]
PRCGPAGGRRGAPPPLPPLKPRGPPPQYNPSPPPAGGAPPPAPVPRQAIRFLNDVHNRQLIRGVIAAGNRNFGDGWGRAGDVIAQKCAVPYLYRFELMGTPDDINTVRKGVSEFWQRQPQNV